MVGCEDISLMTVGTTRKECSLSRCVQYLRAREWRKRENHSLDWPWLAELTAGHENVKTRKHVALSFRNGPRFPTVTHALDLAGEKWEKFSDFIRDNAMIWKPQFLRTLDACHVSKDCAMEEGRGLRSKDCVGD